jgi:hypothetical protein
MKNVSEKVLHNILYKHLKNLMKKTEDIIEKNGKKTRLIICYNREKVVDDIEYLEKRIKVTRFWNT